MVQDWHHPRTRSIGLWTSRYLRLGPLPPTFSYVPMPHHAVRDAHQRGLAMICQAWNVLTPYAASEQSGETSSKSTTCGGAGLYPVAILRCGHLTRHPESQGGQGGGRGMRHLAGNPTLGRTQSIAQVPGTWKGQSVIAVFRRSINCG